MVWQHGIAGGYYLTFLMGGFITSAARLVRNNVRPLVLPAADQPPSTLKTLYDIAGTIASILILNYAASPFMLLTLKDSFRAWACLGYYGHVIIFGGLLFFYAGGTKYFKSLQVKRGIVQGGKRPEANGKGNVSAPNSGTSTPVSEKTFTVAPIL